MNARAYSVNPYSLFIFIENFVAPATQKNNCFIEGIKRKSMSELFENLSSVARAHIHNCSVSRGFTLVVEEKKKKKK
jgi:hypothetical protein